MTTKLNLTFSNDDGLTVTTIDDSLEGVRGYHLFHGDPAREATAARVLNTAVFGKESWGDYYAQIAGLVLTHHNDLELIEQAAYLAYGMAVGHAEEAKTA